MKKNRLISYASIFFLGVIILFWITYIDKAGVHGDEAWTALDGIHISKQGIVRPYGIVPYTGLLQSLANAGIFSIFDVGVVQMRIVGILCNIIGVILLLFFLRTKFTHLTALFFLALLGQSALYLLYGKISWEVCSFNLLFTTLLLLSFYYVYTTQGRSQMIWSFVFLSVSLLGGYNHIIFSCLPLAGLTGVVLWTLFKRYVPSNATTISMMVLFLAVLNSGLLYLSLKMDLFYAWPWPRITFFLLPFILIAVECLFIKSIGIAGQNGMRRLMAIPIHQNIRFLILALCFISFIKIHGVLLLKVYSQQIVVLHIFSHPLTPSWGILLTITGSLLAGFVLYLITKDVLTTNSPWVYVLLSYLALLNLYTQIASMRYLLIATILLFLYTSIQLALERPLVRYTMACVLLVNLFAIQTILWRLNFNDDRKVTPTYFVLSNDFIENSAHFLSFSPVLQVIHKHKIGSIQSEEPFFIGNVFNFYREVDPTIKKYRNTLEVNYDHQTQGTGFKIRKVQ